MVNGVSVKDMQHSEVVAAIKAGGEETSLLVVDAETEEFFKMCDVLPTEEHLSGALPEPKRAAEQEEVAAEVKPKVSVSSSASSASSNASLQGPGSSEPPPQVEPPAPADILGLSLSLAQVKERARQKRSGKKAPTMNWSKRNELFGNL
ncbi:hypothetical protein JOQ06_029177 [Pogonophryne albipinna]|uniref:EBP50 C-terminal domain-containing protein n=1 Tax=Pogonophryne albipinna TaxID=1090488 RepID=A0AAD6B7Y6_9TELE|nr:hypothetical protein JOQ06_029177 [Pogonophryne albipinna]